MVWEEAVARLSDPVLFGIYKRFVGLYNVWYWGVLLQHQGEDRLGPTCPADPELQSGVERERVK